MTDYIKREDAIEAIDRILNYCEEIDLHLPKEEQSGYKMLNDYLAVRRYLVNSVEVVRCKDCKYYHKEWNGSETHYYEDYWCEWVEPDENDFCSLGERAEA